MRLDFSNGEVRIDFATHVRCTFAPLANPPPRRLGVEVVYLPNTNSAVM